MVSHIRVRACALIIENDSVLLVEFRDENGLHYNLPGGGVQLGETVREAVSREVMEEASIEVDVLELAFVYEYNPHLSARKYGDTASLQLIFECSRREGNLPKLAEAPDTNQTGVKWIRFNDLKNVILYPEIKDEITLYKEKKKVLGLIEEHRISNGNSV